MRTDVPTLAPEDSLMEAVLLMRRFKLRRLPIVMGDRLVGLLTDGDLKRAEPSTLSDTEEHFTEVMEGTQVTRIMVQNLITITPDTPLLEAARLLQDEKYGALPVLDGEVFVGVLSDSDLIGTLVTLLESEA